MFGVCVRESVCTCAAVYDHTCISADCRVVCHPDCKDYAVLPCIPSVPTPKKKHNVSVHVSEMT